MTTVYDVPPDALIKKLVGKLKKNKAITVPTWGKYVKTGVNVSTYPGVKIGAYSWINPGLVVKKDLPPCSHLKGDWEVGTAKEECRVDLSVWRP